MMRGRPGTRDDSLDSRVPALVVPYGGADEDEQLTRARRLEALGAVRVLPADEMTPPRLAAEMASLATFAPAVSGLDLRRPDRVSGRAADVAQDETEDRVHLQIGETEISDR